MFERSVNMRSHHNPLTFTLDVGMCGMDKSMVFSLREMFLNNSTQGRSRFTIGVQVALSNLNMRKCFPSLNMRKSNLRKSVYQMA